MTWRVLTVCGFASLVCLILRAVRSPCNVFRVCGEQLRTWRVVWLLRLLFRVFCVACVFCSVLLCDDGCALWLCVVVFVARSVWNVRSLLSWLCVFCLGICVVCVFVCDCGLCVVVFEWCCVCGFCVCGVRGHLCVVVLVSCSSRSVVHVLSQVGFVCFMRHVLCCVWCAPCDCCVAIFLSFVCLCVCIVSRCPWVHMCGVSVCGCEWGV